MKNAVKTISPQAWNESFSAKPASSSDPRRLRNATLRRWAGTSAEMRQPILDHHFLALHLGGAKQICRTGEGRSITVDLKLGDVSLTSIGSSYNWVTSGPIDFAHLYFSQAQFKRCIGDTFDRDPANVKLVDGVGLNDVLLENLMAAMVNEISIDCTSPLYIQNLLETIIARLVHSHSTLCVATPSAKQSIAPHKLRQVREYIEEHLPQKPRFAGAFRRGGVLAGIISAVCSNARRGMRLTNM